jgi:hypothetical protein
VTHWHLVRGFAVREVEPTSVDVLAGAIRAMEVRGADQRLRVLLYDGRTWVCSCDDPGCDHMQAVLAYLMQEA